MDGSCYSTEKNYGSKNSRKSSFNVWHREILDRQNMRFLLRKSFFLQIQTIVTSLNNWAYFKARSFHLSSISIEFVAFKDVFVSFWKGINEDSFFQVLSLWTPKKEKIFFTIKSTNFCLFQRSTKICYATFLQLLDKASECRSFFTFPRYGNFSKPRVWKNRSILIEITADQLQLRR